MGRRKRTRPSAREQQRGARGLVIVAAALVIALMGGAGAFLALVSGQTGAAAAPVHPQQALPPVVQDDDAPPSPSEPEEPEATEDPRAAALALDPNRTTDWRFDGTGEKTVYLTFDDGPSENTARILDVLDSYGVKATFFVTGHEPDRRDLIKRAYEAGHSIGLHTFSHDYASVYASEEAFFSDLEAVGEVVKEQIGFVPYLTRFPGGASNTVSASYSPGIMTALAKDLPARGYQFYDWNVSSGDASGNNVDVEKIVASSCVEGYTNVMLLCHDSATKGTTVEALPRIIEFYRERGYAFAAIDRDAFVCHHGVSN